MVLCYFSAVVAAMILIHSFFSHREKNYSSMRIQTEIGALALFISSILVLLITTNPTALKTVLMYDFFFCGILNLTIQLCDTYMFYSRYRSVCRISNSTSYRIHCYIWLCCVLPRFPAYNIVPAFYDTNSHTFAYAFYIANACSTTCIVLYNFYFTVQFSKILLFIYNPLLMRLQTPFHALGKIKWVGLRSIGHCFTSSLGAVLYVAFPDWGRLAQEVTIVAGMHFWFNMTIERDGCLYQVCSFDESSSEGGSGSAAHSGVDEDQRIDMADLNQRYVPVLAPVPVPVPLPAPVPIPVLCLPYAVVCDSTT